MPLLIPRRKTRKVIVGDRTHGLVGIGGDAPVALQSMTSTYTWDIDATVRQINDLHKAGADLVRVAVPEKRDTAALKEILNQVRLPIIADVHFHFERALDECGFLRNQEARPNMIRNMRNMWGRAELTEQEIRTLHGVVKELTTLREKKR